MGFEPMTTKDPEKWNWEKNSETSYAIINLRLIEISVREPLTWIARIA